MRATEWLGAMVTGLSVLTTAPAAFAAPATEGSLQLGLGFRYGAELNEGDFNPWGTGIGLNAGYTMSNDVSAACTTTIRERHERA